MKYPNYFVILILAVVLPQSVLANPSDNESLERARAHVQKFYDSELDSLWDAFTGEMKAALGNREAFSLFRRQVSMQIGEETKVLEESLNGVGPYQDYVRIAKFERADMPIMVRVMMQDDSIAGFSVSPQKQPAPSDFTDYRTRTPLRLPFTGQWRVFWGGRSVEENYHAAVPDQRYAYDFVIVRDGDTHRGDGAANKDYYCFGEPVLAPGDGVVVKSVDGQTDHVPGDMVPSAGAGNHVIIDHGNEEFSFLAHLRQGSLAVESGDTVSAGDQIGECGNSGHSSEPHLHYHLQRDATFHAGAGGEGLPAQFLDYLENGQPRERGEPVRGQTVEPL